MVEFHLRFFGGMICIALLEIDVEALNHCIVRICKSKKEQVEDVLL